MKLPTVFLRTFLILVLLGDLSRAGAAPGDVDLLFDPGSGSTGYVFGAIVQPDGKYVVAGGVGITRLNADGSNDLAFARRDGSYGSLALQADGKVLAGRLDGIDRLNPDGSLDVSFQVVLGPAGESGVSAIVVQPDGRVLIGGVFSSVNGAAASGIARLNPNGSLDTTFSTDTVVGGVFALALQADGKVLVGGRFYNSAAVQNKSLLRLNSDGSVDASFTSGTESTGVVISLAVQADGKVFAGGAFLIGSRSNIARLNPDGSVDTAFSAGTGANDTVFSVALQSDGKLVIAGGFTEVNGAPRETLARLNADGELDTNFDPDAGIDVTNGVAAVTAQPDGKLLIRGSFTNVNGVPREGFARLDNDGELDGGFIPSRGVNNTVSLVVVQPDGKVLIGGDFTAINSQARNGVARLNQDGSLDPAVFDRGLAGTFGPVTAISLQPDGKVLIGTRNGLVRTHSNGSLDAGFSPYSGRAATALAVQPDGKILFGGYIVEEFLDEDGVIATYYRAFLTRRNADGTQDSSFQETTGEKSAGVGIADFAVQPDGKVLVAGSFNTFQGAARFGIARIHANGTVDATFDAQANGSVSSLVLQADGKLVIGGVFTTVHGSNRRRIARVFDDGTLDSSFDPGTGANDGVASIARQADGKLLVAGYFTNFDGTARSRIARLQQNGELDLSFVSDADERIFGLALQPDGHLFIGGAFSTVNGVLRPRVARLFGDSSTSPTFATWIAGFGLSSAFASATADPDHDGLANGVEYILGGNPAHPWQPAGRPTASLNPSSMLLTFSRADAAETPDATLTVEASTELLTWPAVFTIGATTATSSLGVTILENGPAADTITVEIALGVHQRLFARLVAKIAP